MEFVEQEAIRLPDLADRYNKFQELYGRKLWHQLTEAVYEFVQDPTNIRGDNFVQLCENFVSKFEAKINQLKFAQILTAIGRSNTAEAARVLGAALEKSGRLGPEATLLLQSELGLIRLQQGEVAEVKELLPKGKATLEDLQSADTSVHSAYYRLAMEYYKVVGPPEAFYSAALMYLAYTPTDAMPLADQHRLATDISLAAITGDGVFNFGEVLATPVLKVLEGTSEAWLAELLRVFNAGDIDSFNSLVAQHKQVMQAQPALSSRADFVKEKIALLCLINIIFERPSHERSISFADIARRSKLPLDQVEWLIMRAMSLKLIKGLMDEVEQVLHASWVQPRVLGVDQLKQLSVRLDAWRDTVGRTLVYVEDQTPELFG